MNLLPLPECSSQPWGAAEGQGPCWRTSGAFTRTVRRSRRGEHNCPTETCAWSPVAGPDRGRSLSHTLSRIQSGGGAVYFPSVAGCIACKDASPFPSRVHRHPLRPSPNGYQLSARHCQRLCTPACAHGHLSRGRLPVQGPLDRPRHDCLSTRTERTRQRWRSGSSPTSTRSPHVTCTPRRCLAKKSSVRGHEAVAAASRWRWALVKSMKACPALGYV